MTAYERREMEQELFSGSGQDVTVRSPKRVKHKKSSSTHNGQSRTNRFSIGIERFEDHDGEHLVSYRPEEETSLEATSRRRRNSELLSGKRADSDWRSSR